MDALYNKAINEELISAHSLRSNIGIEAWLLGRITANELDNVINEDVGEIVELVAWWRRKRWWRHVFSANSSVGNLALTEMHKIVGSQAEARRRSWVSQQMVSGWPKLLWSSSFFVYLRSPKLLALDVKSLVHVADSWPPSCPITKSPWDEISPLESPSMLLKLVVLFFKPEVWLSSTAGDLLYWC